MGSKLLQIASALITIALVLLIISVFPSCNFKDYEEEYCHYASVQLEWQWVENDKLYMQVIGEIPKYSGIGCPHIVGWKNGTHTIVYETENELVDGLMDKMYNKEPITMKWCYIPKVKDLRVREVS